MEMQYTRQEDEDQNDDALSFCDLPLNREEGRNYLVSDPSSTPCSDDDFEFSMATTQNFYDFTTDQHKTASLSRWKSESFHHEQSTAVRVHVTPRSSSYRYPYQSCGGSNGPRIPRKRYNVLIGVTKLPPRMELNDIRRRQSQRRDLSTVAVGGEKLSAVACSGSAGSSGKGHWGNFMRGLRLRSNVVSALARVSFSCVRRV